MNLFKITTRCVYIAYYVYTVYYGKEWCAFMTHIQTIHLAISFSLFIKNLHISNQLAERVFVIYCGF